MVSYKDQLVRFMPGSRAAQREKRVLCDLFHDDRCDCARQDAEDPVRQRVLDTAKGFLHKGFKLTESDDNSVLFRFTADERGAHELAKFCRL
jgi:hypothetical protein